MTIQANQGFGVSVFGATSSGGGGATSPGGSSLQIQYNASGSFGGMAGTSWDDTNRSLTLTGATVTTSKPLFDLSQTWNAGGVTFTGWKLNITDTASASASLLMDLQVGGSSKFSIRKDGRAYGTLFGLDNSNALFFAGNLTYLYAGGAAPLAVSSSTAIIINGSLLGFSSGTSADLLLGRNAAASLRLGAADAAAPVAQTLGVQSVVAGTTNTAGANFTIKGSAGTGTGAGGSIIFQVAPAGSTGTAQNAFATALAIGTADAFSSTGVMVSPGVIQIASTSGDNKGIRISNTNLRGYNGASIALGSAFSSTTDNIANLYLLSAAVIGWNGDVSLARDAANTLALRNGTSAQELRVYKTITGTVYKALLGDNNLIKIAGEAFTNGAGASIGTLTNAPAVGDPTKWIPIDDNGTTRYIPAW